MEGYFDIIEIPPDLKAIMEAEVPITEEDEVEVS